MTRRERAQVVELLRCAADNATVYSPVASAAFALGHRDNTSYPAGRIEHLAHLARDSAECWNTNHGYQGEAYRALLLEAARRVEEGWTP